MMAIMMKIASANSAVRSVGFGAILIAILFSSKFRPKFFTIAECRSDGKIAAVETNPEGL